MFGRRFLDDERGSAAEFALVLPLAMAFLFGIIDAGRYMWQVNQAEKATQAGARAAATTAMIPDGLINHSFSVSNGVPQGAPVPTNHFTGIRCVGTTAGAAPACTWIAIPGVTLSNTSSNITLNPSAARFATVLARMKVFMPNLAPSNVTVSYLNSGLGFAGDPSGPDISPVIRVQLSGMQFRPILTSVFGLNWNLPPSPYSITQEDGQGACYEEIC
ncbi:TadE family protein [Parerythrobacter aurantius]|uniref:TadE/TadG family type IV pilus assembly protein n=1 Tax=Parerythrobacter aurantius TaxID=3127706 RepID=UPI00324EBFF0